MRKLILTSDQSPGDMVMLTAAVRGLHQPIRECSGSTWVAARAAVGQQSFTCQLEEGSPGVEVLRMHYPAIHSSISKKQLGNRLPVSKFYGDIHLSAAEKSLLVPGHEFGVPERLWIVISGDNKLNGENHERPFAAVRRARQAPRAGHRRRDARPLHLGRCWQAQSGSAGAYSAS